MNDMGKRLLIKAVLGFFSGILVGGVFLLPTGAVDVFFGLTDKRATILYLICCGLYGMAVMAGMVLYDIERYSLLCATATHFMIMLAGLLFLGIALGWRLDDVLVWLIFLGYNVIQV